MRRRGRLSCARSVTLSDINRRALRFCGINAALNAVPDVTIVESDLFESIPGPFDLIIANPPYLVDPLARTYRHGGGALGFEALVAYRHGRPVALGSRRPASPVHGLCDRERLRSFSCGALIGACGARCEGCLRRN